MCRMEAVMRTLFHLRQITPNIGNSLIALGHEWLLRRTLGDQVNLVTLDSAGSRGGFTPNHVYEINQLADGLIVGLGNVFENGALNIVPSALSALEVPMLVLGASSGRVYSSRGKLVRRTDSLPAEQIVLLCQAADEVLVRDESSQVYLQSLGLEDVQVSGCPTLFLNELVDTLPQDSTTNDCVIISLRNPRRMSVPYRIQGRVWADVRSLIEHFRGQGNDVRLLCHDVQDVAFASGFPQVPWLYSEDPRRVLSWLRSAALSVTFRLHSFLPCMSLGTPSINLSYDERAKSLVQTVGMSEWDIDYASTNNIVELVRDRADNLDRYNELIYHAQTKWEEFRRVYTGALHRLVERVGGNRLVAA